VLNKRFLLILLFIFIFNLSVIDNVRAIEIDSKLTTEFNYSHIDDNSLPKAVIEDLESDIESTLELSLSGIYKLYQYNIILEGETEDSSLDIEEATISGMIANGILEVGKRDWTWGKGFDYSPTYPLNSDENYIGSELSWMVDYSTFKVGASLDSDDKRFYSSWIKFNSLLESSDYTIILSYQLDDSELDDLYHPAKKSNTLKKEDGINLGVNYSKDFLNGLTMRGEYNLRHWRSEREESSYYLLGGEYITEGSKVITLEYYRKEDDYLICVIGNQGDSFADWSWELEEVYNLSDFGQRRSFELAYTAKDKLTPSVEVINFLGPKDSQFQENPKDWTVKFKVTIDFL